MRKKLIKGSATVADEEGKRYYVIDEDAQQCLVDASARPLPRLARARGADRALRLRLLQ